MPSKCAPARTARTGQGWVNANSGVGNKSLTKELTVKKTARYRTKSAPYLIDKTRYFWY
jgi:hypothetical protein